MSTPPAADRTATGARTLSGKQSGTSVAAFFILAFALIVPFWVVGALTGLQLLPGIPVAALATVCPALAALILVHREQGGAGTSALLHRALDYRRIPSLVWYAPILLLNPGIAVVSFVVLRLSGTAVPLPRIQVGPTLILCVVFFVAALGEELGWSGYATDPMQERWGALGAGMALGMVWAVYHYVGLGQAHRSLGWIAWWSLGTVATRVIMVWLFNKTGKSVFAAALFHMTINLAWQLFPVQGSYFDPRVSGLTGVAVAAILTVVGRPRTLVRRGAG